MNLYEIDTVYQGILTQAKEAAEQNDGIIPDDLSAKLDAIECTRDLKMENVVKAFKNEAALSDMIRGELKALQQRIKSHDSAAEWLKKYLGNFVKEGEKREFSCGKISWRKSSPVIIDDLKAIPEQYIKVEYSAMKTEIKEAIEKGETITGAHIEQKQNIQIK
jgi:hypothetical protein